MADVQDKNPKLSVVIPTYNHERYVREAIQSVLDQSFQNFEIIICDDASSDGTVDEIKKFDDLRIKFFNFEKNMGGAYALNYCIKQSSGEYIAILSSDDVFLPDKLEKQVKILDENKDVGAVFGWAEIIAEDGSEFKDETHFYYDVFKQKNRSRFEWLNRFFFHGNCLCHPSALIRKRCYDEVGFYDSRFAQLPDLDMWVRLCMKYEIFVMQENLIRFRILNNMANASGQRPEVKRRSHFEYVKLLNHYLEIDSLEDFRAIFPNSFYVEKFADSRLIPFYILMTALTQVNSSHLAHKVFGVMRLFDLFDVQEIVSLLKKEFQFDYGNLIELNGKYKLFSPISQEEFSQKVLKLEEYKDYNRGLKTSVENRDKKIENLKTSVENKDKKIENLEANVENKDKKIENLEASVEKKNKKIENLEVNVSKNYKTIKDLNKSFIKLRKHGDHLRMDLNNRIKAFNNLQIKSSEEISALRRSYSFRIGRFFVFPVAFTVSLFKKIFR